MRRLLIWALIVVGTALVQTTWLDALRFQGAVPDLTLLLVMYIALVDGEERAMMTAVLGGVFQDVSSDMVLGHHVLSLVLIGYAAGRTATRLVTEHPAIKVALVFAGGLLNGVLFTAILFVQQPHIHAWNRILTGVVPEAFYTALVTPLLFGALDRVLARPLASQGGAATP